jgi:hypothetical protein
MSRRLCPGQFAILDFSVPHFVFFVSLVVSVRGRAFPIQVSIGNSDSDF